MGKMGKKRDQLDQEIGMALSKVKLSNTGGTECANEETIAAYAEGCLPSDEVESIEEHLVSCKACIDAIASLSYSLTADESEMIGSIPSRMIDRAKGLMKPGNARPFSSIFSSWLSALGPKPTWAVASVLLAVVMFGTYHYQTTDSTLVSTLPAGMAKLLVRIPPEVVTRGAASTHKGVATGESDMLRSGDILRSLDRFRIEFSLKEDAFAYLILIDSLRKPTVLYPLESDSPVIKTKSHKTVFLPDDSQWFRLDSNTGNETIYLIASTNALPDMYQRVSQLSISGSQLIAEVFPDARIQTFKIKHE
jgi:hypothetical protein